MINQKKWDLWFLGLCKYIGTASKDDSTKCGAVLIDNKRRIISVGFNGFPRGVEDKLELYQNREEKLKRVVHAEINAILFASRSLENCTLYTYPFLPCSRCTCHVIQVGITRVIAPALFGDRKLRWEKDIELSKSLFTEAGVKFLEYGHEEVLVDGIYNKIDVEID